jgi:hypothetical protein
VLTSLTVLGDTSFEFTNTSSNDDYERMSATTKGKLTDSAISLRSSRDHVLDEITVSRGVDDSDVVFGSLKLPEGNVDGDTTFTLSL